MESAKGRNDTLRPCFAAWTRPCGVMRAHPGGAFFCALVETDPGRALHAGIERPIDDEERPPDTTDFRQGQARTPAKGPPTPLGKCQGLQQGLAVFPSEAGVGGAVLPRPVPVVSVSFGTGSRAPSGRAVRRLWRCRKRRSRPGRAACRRWRYSWGALPGSRETRVQPSPSGFLPPPISRVPAGGRSAAMAEPSTSTRPRKRPRAAASRSPPPPPTAGASSTQGRPPRAGASPSVSRRKTGTAPDRLPAPPRPAPPMTA